MELRLFWSSGGAGAPRGPAYWPPHVERRKSIYDAMRQWSPPPALGQVPEDITEPMAVMLWGITAERVEEWLSSDDGGVTLGGVAASPGVAEGRARVIFGPDQLGELELGEILVAPSTSTSWTPVFGTDRGGRPRRRGDDVPRCHRRAGVRTTGRRRRRLGDDAHQDRRPATRRRRQGRRDDPGLSRSSLFRRLRPSCATLRHTTCGRPRSTGTD